MNYSLLIDVVHSAEWKLNPTQACVFSWIYNLPSWADKMTIGTDTWHFASRNKAVSDIPFVTDKPDTIYRVYLQLKKKGLIDHQKVGKSDFLMLTDKAKLWGRKTNFPDQENFSEKTGNDSQENFPTNSLISIKDKVIKDKEGLPPEELEIQEALEKCYQWFRDYPAMTTSYLERCRLKLTDKNKKWLIQELEKWVRHKTDQPHIISSITKYIPKTFPSWLQRAVSFGDSKQHFSNDSSTVYDGDASFLTK